MYHITPQAAMLLSVNIVGTNPCNIMRANPKIYAENRVETGSSNIDRSKEESVRLLCDDVRDNY